MTIDPTVTGAERIARIEADAKWYREGYGAIVRLDLSDIGAVWSIKTYLYNACEFWGHQERIAKGAK